MTMSFLRCLTVLAIGLGSAAAAEIRPTMRPDRIETAVVSVPSALQRSVRPIMRRATGIPAEARQREPIGAVIARALNLPPRQAQEVREETAITGGSAVAVSRSHRPSVRPRRILRRAAARASGSVCNSRRIKGQRITAIAGALPGCGVAQPVSITEVAGIRLSQAAKVECRTAQALEKWILEGVGPAVGRTGGGLVGLQVAAHYSCRTRNNRAGAKISEHGKGRAIDISALVLADGTRITVLEGWRGPKRHQEILRASHRSACGPFGTVLGPDGDRYHQDHFHFDVAQHRSGSYCR